MDDLRADLRKTLQSSYASPFVYIQCPLYNDALLLDAIVDSLPVAARDSFQSAVPTCAVVDCQLVMTVRQLYEQILNQLAAFPVQWKDDMRNWDGQKEGFHFKKVKPTKRGRDSDVDEHHQSKRRRAINEAATVYETNWNTAHQPDRDPLDPPRDSSEYLNKMIIRLFDVFGQETMHCRRFIVLTNAEHLTTLPSIASLARGGSLINTLARLDEFTRRPLTVVFTSRLAYEKIREPSFPIPKLLTMNPINEKELVDVIAERYEPSSEDCILDGDEYRTLFRGLVEHIASVSATYTASHIQGVAFLCSKMWKAWKTAAEYGNPPCRVTDTARLAQGIKDVLANELQRIAEPRSWDSAQPAATLSFAGRLEAASGQSTSDVNASNAFLNALSTPSMSPQRFAQPQTHTTHYQRAIQKKANESLASSLPDVARWLLLSAYYASVNRPSTDVRFFVRIDDESPRKGKKVKKRSPSKSPTKAAAKRADLTGGRPFALERMLAIFESIANDELPGIVRSSDVLSQVAMLVSVRLLQRTSTESKAVEGVKLRCQLDKESAERIALSVGLKNWRDFLDEFE